jgi:CheY-like chemotaxis protein
MPTFIMVIDDEPLICRLLEHQLGGAGYEVVTYQRYTEAMSELARRQPDLILLDVMMPEISGWDLCRQIRASSSVPIIMLTAKDGDEDVIHGLTGGADDYLSKPFKQSQLIARIEAVLRRSSAPPTRQAQSSVQDRNPLSTTTRPHPTTPLPTNNSALTHAQRAPHTSRQPPHLGAHLAIARQQRGLSLLEASYACGVRWEFLQAIEQGEFSYVPQHDLSPALRSYSRLLSVDLAPYAVLDERKPLLSLTVRIAIIVTLLALMVVTVALVLA